MTIAFMSEEWAKALMEAINASEAYRVAARDWEGDFYFIAELGGDDNPTIYLDLWHGECRAAYKVTDRAAKSPEFEVAGKLSAWKKVIAQQVDPIQALITRQLKLQGNMAKVLRSVKAAQELVNAATKVPTQYPE